MAKIRTVWGIDIGQSALKALALRNVNGELQVEAADVIEHPQILSEPDVDVRELVRNALQQFLDRNQVADSTVCISVPGQSSFTRFVKLPPVEPKKIPDIVRFEAEQQIPFPIVDVIWRWQTFNDPDSPDVEVGIFAMKRSDIDDMLEHFSGVEMNVDLVQMAPLALYNFMVHDQQVAPDGATLLADVGVEKTDLVVADRARIWTRTIQIGGNNFTEALVKTFKLSFGKAEKLKRTAASSKYARQIFQAMRPVFADLVQEMQRSVGYYTSLHRDARFKRLIGLGNGFRLPGLQKFLEQNLSIPVVRIDSYNKLRLSPAINAPMFAENVLAFPVSYGLALQGLGEARVATDLLPRQITRARQWSKKRPWFGAAAAVLLLTLAMPLYRAYSDKSKLSRKDVLMRAQTIARSFKSRRSEFNKWSGQGDREERQLKNVFQLYRYRDYWPALQNLISRGIQDQARDQRLLTEYATARTDAEKQKIRDKIKQIPRSERQMIFIERMAAVYKSNVMDSVEVGLRGSATDRGSFGGRGVRRSGRRKTGASGKTRRGFLVRIIGRTPLPQLRASPFLRSIFSRWEDLAQGEPALSVVDFDVVSIGTNQGRTASGRDRRGRGSWREDDYYGPEPGRTTDTEEAAKAAEEDPLFPGDVNEDQAKDTVFEIGLVVSIDEPSSAAPDGN